MKRHIENGINDKKTPDTTAKRQKCLPDSETKSFLNIKLSKDSGKVFFFLNNLTKYFIKSNSHHYLLI